MSAIGMCLVYLGYTGGLWGVALIQGKNLGLKTLFGATWPPDVPSATGSKSTPSGSTPAGSSSGANIFPTPTGTQSSTGSDLGI